jgi:preprotein translocase subunit SecG
MEILLVLQIIVVIALIAVILVQKTSSDGFTGGSSSPNSFLTGRASANLFTRATSILATIFIVNSLALAYIASHIDRGDSIIDSAMQEAEQNKPSSTTSEKANNEPAKLAVPASETSAPAASLPAEAPVTPATNSVPTESQQLENTQQPNNSVPVSE